MKVRSLSCPKCQAPIEDTSRFCSHCGTPIHVDDDATKVKYTYQEVDDARIREADVKEKIRLRELELELLKLQNETRQKKEASRMKLTVLCGFLLVLFFLAVALVASPDGAVKGACLILCIPVIIAMIIVIPKVFRNH